MNHETSISTTKPGFFGNIEVQVETEPSNNHTYKVKVLCLWGHILEGFEGLPQSSLTVALVSL